MKIQLSILYFVFLYIKLKKKSIYCLDRCLNIDSSSLFSNSTFIWYEEHRIKKYITLFVDSIDSMNNENDYPHVVRLYVLDLKSVL